MYINLLKLLVINTVSIFEEYGAFKLCHFLKEDSAVFISVCLPIC